ncbi:hypothetical protein TMatcc_001629 [Talaromyces marneffei ATCC 18224]|uniref:Uncharacterized protein n=1 Tax=Talaromyces marneffei (strain ATCC 18224 / CBS 334.59 / QM 7333) TaxID=441960 RepID=B6QHC8_TALMQ|nr:uncharacterized protein EYB26_007162 [Talaromyces marneffei]EEA22773.1 hypothetical protein PMAA_093870 [Talaromyces marneffei ATCC 18224]KAE8551656.1 hypothetical protein EYB25_005546 [Talaromyces marneffei]QGA19473.1 hypothetical protein EYB26_007162 [Talaromyces marneffei]
MAKWLFLNGPKNQQENHQQQLETASGMRFVHSVNPPNYESVIHPQANASGGIQINHTENGTQVITVSRHVCAESVPESSVTEDCEGNDADTVNSEGKTEDNEDDISNQKQQEQRREEANSRSTSKSVIPRSMSSAVVQNNAGEGIQVNTIFHSGTGYHFMGCQFNEKVYFR